MGIEKRLLAAAWRTLALVRSGNSALALIALVLLSGCDNKSGNALGSGAPSFDEQAMLAAIKFDQPIAVTVSLQQIFLNGNQFRDENNGRIVSILSKTGYLGPDPAPSTSPWWTFRYSPLGVYSEGTYVVPVATRVITDRSDARNWTEGAISYYAETISYSIQPADPIFALIQKRFTSGQIRLVLMNDPAVGKWQVWVGGDRGTRYFENDPQIVAQELATVGGYYADGFVRSVKAAQHKSFDVIEARLKAQGLLARVDGQPELLSSPARHLVYFVDAPTPVGTLTQVQQYCRSLTVGSYGRFRIPTSDELGAIVALQNDWFLDTPDRRFWGQTKAARPSPDAVVLFVTNTFTVNFSSQGSSLDLDTLSGVQPYSSYYNMQTEEIDQSGRMAARSITYDVAGNHPVPQYGNLPTRWRVVCVADDH